MNDSNDRFVASIIALSIEGIPGIRPRYGFECPVRIEYDCQGQKADKPSMQVKQQFLLTPNSPLMNPS